MLLAKNYYSLWKFTIVDKSVLFFYLKYVLYSTCMSSLSQNIIRIQRKFLDLLTFSAGVHTVTVDLY